MDIVAGVPDSAEQPDRQVARAQMRGVLERKVSELPEILLLRESLAKEIDLAESDIFEFAGACCDSIVAAVLASLSGEPQS